jgi:transcriptional regulator of acetoin/glycerol metabolism
MASLGAQRRKAIADIDRKFIKDALAETGGNITRASKLLEISRPWFHMKMKKYKIKVTYRYVGHGT